MNKVIRTCARAANVSKLIWILGDAIYDSKWVEMLKSEGALKDEEIDYLNLFCTVHVFETKDTRCADWRINDTNNKKESNKQVPKRKDSRFETSGWW